MHDASTTEHEASTALRRHGMAGRAVTRTRLCSAGHDVPDVTQDTDLRCLGPGAHAVFDDEVTSALVAGGITVELANQGYTLPADLLEEGDALLEESRHHGVLFNGPVLGLNTDVCQRPVTTVWSVTPAGYFDYIRSDRLASRRWADTRDASLFVSPDGHLLGHRTSPLLNTIGVAALAVTTDQYLVTVAHSTANQGGTGLLVPAGGALDPADFRGRHRVVAADLFMVGSQREFMEETGLAPQDITSGVMLGYARLLEWCCAPTFFTLALLAIDSREVHRRSVPEHEAAFVDEVHTSPLAPAHQWDTANPASLLPDVDPSRMSGTLLAALALLATSEQLPHIGTP